MSMANTTSATTSISGSFSLEHNRSGDNGAQNNTADREEKLDRPEGATAESPSKLVEEEKRRAERERSVAPDSSRAEGRAPQSRPPVSYPEREEGELVEGEQDEQTGMDVDVDEAPQTPVDAETVDMHIESSPELSRKPLQEKTAEIPNTALEDVRDAPGVDAQDQSELASGVNTEPAIPPEREVTEVQDQNGGINVGSDAEEGEVAEPVGVSAPSSSPLSARLSYPITDVEA